MDHRMKKRADLTIIEAIYKLEEMEDEIRDLKSELEEVKSNQSDPM